MKKLSFVFLMLSFCIFIGLTSCENKNGREADSITIYGTVIDQSTGSPLYNVFISEKNGVGGSTVTGADGSYEFTLPLDGTSNSIYYLVASKDGYVSAEYELKMSDVDKKRHIKVDFQLSVDRATTILSYIGKVTDKSGHPLQNVDIVYYRGTKDEEMTIIMQRYTKTNQNGDYSIELAASEIPSEHNYVVMLSAYLSGYDEQERFFEEPEVVGKTIKTDFVLESGY